MIEEELWSGEDAQPGSRGAQIRRDVQLFQKATISLLGIVALSTTYFHIVEKLDWLDAVYFTIVSMATVGYGDISPHTKPGKIGAMVMILVGIGIFGTFINLFVKRQSEVREARSRKFRQRRGKAT